VPPALVVIGDPGRDDLAGVVDRRTGLSSSRIQTLKLSQMPFCIGLPDKVPGDPARACPTEHGIRGELGGHGRRRSSPNDHGRRRAPRAGARRAGPRSTCPRLQQGTTSSHRLTFRIRIVARRQADRGRVDRSVRQSGKRSGARAPVARLRPRLRRTVNPSSRLSRWVRLRFASPSRHKRMCSRR
jgi:hypothetical protein